MNSIDTEQSFIDQVKEYKSFEFVKLYRSAAETKINIIKSSDSTKSSKKPKKLNKSSQSELDISKCSRSLNKNKKKKGNETLDLPDVEAVEHVSSKKPRLLKKTSLTSTPKNKGVGLDNGVKSIMKNKSSDTESLINISKVSTSSSKPKKRNKSVSFMLEDAEEIVVKKSKTNNSNKEHNKREKELKNKEKFAKTKTYKEKKNLQSKENVNCNQNIEFRNTEKFKTYTNVKDKVREQTINASNTEELVSDVRKILKKNKKCKPDGKKDVEITEGNVTDQKSFENKSKIFKRRKNKEIQDGNTDTEGEPAIKTRKKDLKPEAIAEGLENLNIGDNTHTLTNLLDEMTVVDKNAKKKDKHKRKRNQLKKCMNTEDKPDEVLQQDSNAEEKAKIKRNNRKWNKDCKAESKTRLFTSVLVENLPIKIMCNFKKLLSEHFAKFGTIAGIGVAEAYPSENLKPVFTTTVFFHEEKATTKALEEDNTVFAGNRIRVRRPHPPTQTTIVVRAYTLSDQALSSLFSGAGRVRAIRRLIKGKKTMSTAFVEFDGPETVERALKIAEDVKVNGKTLYVTKFEIREKWGSTRADKNSDYEGDTDGSAE